MQRDAWAALMVFWEKKALKSLRRKRKSASSVNILRMIYKSVSLRLYSSTRWIEKVRLYLEGPTNQNSSNTCDYSVSIKHSINLSLLWKVFRTNSVYHLILITYLRKISRDGYGSCSRFLSYFSLGFLLVSSGFTPVTIRSIRSSKQQHLSQLLHQKLWQVL